MVIGPFGSGLMPGNVPFLLLLPLPYPGCPSTECSSITSHWICAAKARHGQTQSPELTALHLRCKRLAQLPVTPSFVFDGLERPNVKRDKIVRGSDHWLVGPFKEILDSYGFRHSAVRDFLFCIPTAD